MSYVSWGKNRIFVKNIDTKGGTAWTEMPTPKEDSTELSTNEGDKIEAPIEGGELEDVKYKAATYELKYDIRNTKGKAIGISHENGVVSDHYAIIVMPEDPECVACYMPKTSVAVANRYTAAEGFISTFNHTALADKEAGSAMMLGRADYSEGGALSFYPLQSDGSYSEQAITV